MARLIGVAAIVIIAGGGAVAYVVKFRPAAHHHSTPLPIKVIDSQTVGLIAQSGTPGSAGSGDSHLVQMVTSQGTPAFKPLSAAVANAQGGDPQWNAATVLGNTYIFIFAGNGKCLGVAHHSQLVLQHCQPGARNQRWRRVNSVLVVAGHDFYQYANLADQKCLSELAGSGQQARAGLVTCGNGNARPSSQLLAFWWLPGN